MQPLNVRDSLIIPFHTLTGNMSNTTRELKKTNVKKLQKMQLYFSAYLNKITT